MQEALTQFVQDDSAVAGIMLSVVYRDGTSEGNIWCKDNVDTNKLLATILTAITTSAGAGIVEEVYH